MDLSKLNDYSTYYEFTGTSSENIPFYFYKNPYLKRNYCVIIGSLILTIFGAALLVFALYAIIVPNNMEIHIWIFIVVGALFCIPGGYHLVYILCVLCNRPGYSFENLPTFKKP